MKQQKLVKRQDDQAGFAHYIIVVVIVIVALIGVGVYVWMSRDKDNKSTDTNKTSSQTSTTKTIKMLNGKLSLKAVDGWTKAYETSLTKDINGTLFQISVQPQSVDYLKLDTLGGFASKYSTVKTAQGTSLQILKFGKTEASTNLVVSTCMPSNGFGCSPDFDNSKLYMVLSPAGASSQTLGPLDYSLEATDTAISDFEQMAGSLPL